MNVPLEVAKALATAVGGQIGVNVHVGRIPASSNIDKSFGVAMAGSSAYGGNIAQHKLSTQLHITAVCTDAAELYNLDDAIRLNLTKIPYTDERFVVVRVGGLQDNQLIDSERRAGVWNVEVVTLNLKED